MSSSGNAKQDDPYGLSRFISAQESTFERALNELKSGQKRSHWMWFIFPQIDGLGRSLSARKYAIRSREEALAFLEHPILGPRLLECCRALLSVSGKTASDIMGFPDDIKLRSSLTLFEAAGKEHPEFDQVLTRYFGGHRDERTLELLDEF